MINLLKKMTGWQRALLLVVAALPFNLWLFPSRTQYLQGLSGLANPILDTWFGYTPAQAFDLVAALTAPGRSLYALTQVTLDLLYPLIYTGLLAVLMGWLVPPEFGTGRWVAGLLRVPVGVLLADYLENVGIVTLLLVYPAQPAAIAWLTCGLTIVKFGLGLGCLGAVLLAVGKWLLDRLLNR